MGKMIWDGPPWFQYIDEDDAYLLGQVGSLGSGALCGNLADPRLVQEVKAEARRILRERARRARELPSAEPQPKRLAA
jgi:hypothetical protein